MGHLNVKLLTTFFPLCDTGGPPLDETEWHVTDYYDNIRNKLKNLDLSSSHCGEVELPDRLCNLVMNVSRKCANLGKFEVVCRASSNHFIFYP